MELLKRILDFVMDILETITFVGSIFIVVYYFIMQPNEIRGASMDTTFHNGEYILISKLSYKFGEPTKGDVVVFRSPDNKDIEYIKRIIGLPGDRVMVLGGDVYVNGTKFPDSFAQHPTTTTEGGFLSEGQEVTVPADHMFVMGDNRPRSSDSRVFGPVPFSDVIGKVFYRYFPTNRMGPISNPIEDQKDLSEMHYPVYVHFSARA